MYKQRPSLIRRKDYFILAFPILIGLVNIISSILSHLNYKTWGEKITTGGWEGSVVASFQ